METSRTLEQMRESANKMQELVTGKPYEPNAAELAYAKRIQQNEKDRKDISLKTMFGAYGNLVSKRPNFTPYPIAFEDAKRLLLFIIENELGPHQRTFKSDGNAADVINDLVLYFIGSPMSKLALNKGVCLWGNVGIGKTFLFYCLSKMVEVLEAQYKRAEINHTIRQFRTIHAAVMVMEVAQKKSLDVLKKYEVGNILIDDLGTDKETKIWGNETDLLSEVITARYIHFQRTNQITHATTNLPPSKWLERYGTRLDSRFWDMFNVVGVSGVDKRK